MLIMYTEAMYFMFIPKYGKIFFCLFVLLFIYHISYTGSSLHKDFKIIITNV